MSREGDKYVHKRFQCQTYISYCVANSGFIEVFCITDRIQKHATCKESQCYADHLWDSESMAPCCMFGPSSLHKYLMPSPENLYLSVRYSSEKANGSALSRKTLSCLNARLSIKTSSSTTSYNKGQAIVNRKHTNL